jgi:hypothetical protein
MRLGHVAGNVTCVLRMSGLKIFLVYCTAKTGKDFHTKPIPILVAL